MREHVAGLLESMARIGAATRRRVPVVPLFLAACALLMCVSLPPAAVSWLSAPGHTKGGVPAVHGPPAARRHARGTCVRGLSGPRRCRARLIATGADRR
ncbi:hypothetical protein [Streptomyces sp. CBMA152]|uniref:hypothetical protein n=1 Tax=Streptomyces sp. CBMA152 TaxID=1896312 RepID=UPI001660B35C|nr:hypothetical protein [Streptomyces sp. CBMA152]MBD0744055.1 hypothetical protein [Streptomyces sp. CBMA152]